MADDEQNFLISFIEILILINIIYIIVVAFWSELDATNRINLPKIKVFFIGFQMKMADDKHNLLIPSIKIVI